MKATSVILNILKPPGMTSHDVIDFIRDVTHQRRVGHAGTLDPSAAGVLVVMTGRYTRLSRYLMNYDKRYRFELTFGVATDTGDTEGEIVERRDASNVSEEQVREAVSTLRGILEMKPHRYSAAKVSGRKAYEIAREGDEPELEARAVVIHEVRLISFTPADEPRALFEVYCGKGTYVRSLAEVIGRRVDNCAHASFVLRTQIGPFLANEAVTLEELSHLSEEDCLAEAAMSDQQALAGYQSLRITPDQAHSLMHGNTLLLSGDYHMGQVLACFDDAGNLLAMGEVRGSRPQIFQPRTVVSGGR
ncbi:MAG: tRNA pseudouridine(55) synthase TruB [Armatimonadota bacterium]